MHICFDCINVDVYLVTHEQTSFFCFGIRSIDPKERKMCGRNKLSVVKTTGFLVAATGVCHLYFTTLYEYKRSKVMFLFIPKPSIPAVVVFKAFNYSGTIKSYKVLKISVCHNLLLPAFITPGCLCFSIRRIKMSLELVRIQCKVDSSPSCGIWHQEPVSKINHDSKRIIKIC